jgi:hypothetical protein
MEEHKPQPIPEQSLKLGYEVRDVNTRLVLWSVGGLAVLVVIAFVVIGLLYNFLEISQPVRRIPPLLEEAQGLPPGALLQRNPAQDMTQMQREDETILNSYGWVDREAGVVRLPIERAMELTLERGLPTRELQE